MSKNPKVDAFLHKLFGTTPGEGMQPKEAIAYSVAGFGQNFICTIIGSYLTVFMTDALGFDLNTKIGVMSGVMAVAWLMLGTRIFDAFNDPIMGSIVDRTRTKWGKCRPYLKWMAIPIGVVTILCFLPWYPKTGGGFAALSVIYVIWSVVYTVADVPYWGLSSAMTNNTDSRGKMLTVARLACTLGAGIVTVFVPIITSGVTAEYKYNELAVQTPVIVYKINDVNDSTKNIYEIEIEDQKKYFNDIDGDGIGDIKEGNLKEEWIAAGFKYGRTVTYDTKYLNITYKKNGDIKSVEVKEEYYKQNFRSASGLLRTECADANQKALRYTYFIAAIVLVVLAMPMFFYGFKNTKERFGAAEDDNPPTLGHNLGLLFKNKPLLLLVLSGILGGARMVYTYTGGLYFCKYALQNESAYSLLTMLVVPGGLVASVLCPWLTNKFGKKWTFIGSHIIGAVAMIIMFFMWDFSAGALRAGGIYVAAICLILIGIPQGISNIMTYAMIGDTVDYLEWKTGERGEGICFAMQTLMNKIGMAIGAFIGVLAYGMSNISPTDPVGNMDVAGLNKLWMMLVLSGVVSFIACIIPIFFYNLTEKRQREMVKEIAERKAAANIAADLDIPVTPEA